jgi:hypothetical protein
MGSRAGGRLPVEVVEHQPAAVVVDIVPVRLAAPDVAAADGARVRIEQDLARVEAVPVLGAKRALHPVAVLDVLEIEVEHDHRVDVADAELVGKRDLDHRLRLPFSNSTSVQAWHGVRRPRS